ncbi:MAG TPA: D-alanine--D-alanine ligase family protein [Candidatus Polarisedimenticolaceae bacterium]|nr:D-alanine--D-alanine ligase family protein [Candidatus Polarisedimenticolaceae bacterium]
MKPTRVGLLFGGRSVEHEVSLSSARGVARAMGETALVCVPIGVTPEGRWLSPEVSRAILDGDGARVEPPAGGDDGDRIVLDPGRRGMQRVTADRTARPLAVDVVFPLVHGWGGEDGRLQGALDLAGLPCVGAGVLGSAVGMDKAVAKSLLERHGVPVTPWILATRARFARAPAAVVDQVLAALRPPLFVKPANGGSSVGITKVERPGGLADALEFAFAHDRRVLVERGIDAREIECAVLGNDEPEASGLGEIVPSREFYDYEAKYLDDASRLIIPAELDGAQGERLRRQAVEAYRALDLAGFARVDFLVERNGDRYFLNEVNTLPGFTPISMFPKLWDAAGLPFPRLIERLVSLALERATDESTRRTARTTG